jgi:hypothetical protein
MADMANPDSKGRWYYPSPGWLVLLSLAATGFLFLAERVHWFTFDGHKGWSVLFALAAVGAFFLAMLVWFVVAMVLRWRFQFSLRTLLLMAVAVALPFSWLGVAMQKAREQYMVVERIQAVDALAWFIYDNDPNIYDRLNDPLFRGMNFPPPAPTLSTKVYDWLRDALGTEFFHNVQIVSLAPKMLNQTAAELERLPDLRVVELDAIDDATFSTTVAQLRLKLPGVVFRRVHVADGLGLLPSAEHLRASLTPTPTVSAWPRFSPRPPTSSPAIQDRPAGVHGPLPPAIPESARYS